jgi:hypothetical protein
MKTVKIDKDFLTGTDILRVLAWIIKADLIEKYNNKDAHYMFDDVKQKIPDTLTIGTPDEDKNLVNKWKVRYKGEVRVQSRKALYGMSAKYYVSCIGDKLTPEQEREYKHSFISSMCGLKKGTKDYFIEYLNTRLVEDPAMKKNEILFLREGTPRYLFVVA